MFITRYNKNNKFTYKGATKEDLERIKKLRIPPAWTNVKIDKDPNKDLQATGYDEKNRKQYIYNKSFVEKTKKAKFKKINNFNHKKYNNVITKYINRNDLSNDCVLANIIKLMEELNIRVGNESYKKQNGSYGITTLLKTHLKGNKLVFVGKKGITHTKIISNPKSITFIKKILTIKGPNLFYFKDGSKINPTNLNNFIKDKIQDGITCKDIRTYCANKIFLNFMNKTKIPNTEKERKSNVLKGIDYTANELGNTRKICRDSYLSPNNLNKFL